MTQRAKKAILNLAALVGAVVVVAGAFNPLLRPAAKAGIVLVLDSTYVFQQSYDNDSFRDSLTHKQEVDSILRMVRDVKVSQAAQDSSLRCLRRNKPRWCAE